MPTSIIPLPLSVPDGENIWYPSRCKLCVCFEDEDFVVNYGDYFLLILSLPSLPLDGEDFDINGTTFTYRNSPADPYDILIGANTTDTLLFTLAKIRLLPVLNPADYFTAIISGDLFINANYVGTQYAVVFTPGTSPLFQFSVFTGANPELLPEFRILFEVLIRKTGSLVIYEAARSFAIIPKVTRHPQTGEPVVEMCTLIDAFINEFIARTLPDFGTGFAAYNNWLVDFIIRFSSTYLGNPNQIFSTQSNIYTSTDAICPDGTDYVDWSHIRDTDGNVQWMNTRKTGLSYCRGTSPVFYAAIRGQTDYNLTVDWTGGSAMVVVNAGSRAAILYVNPNDYLPVGYIGEVRVALTFSPPVPGDAVRYEKIFYTIIPGPCCTTIFYFLNRFGKYEVIECSSEIQYGIEVKSDTFIRCDDCERSSEEIQYGTLFSERVVVMSPRLNIMDDEQREFIKQFIYAPEVWLFIPPADPSQPAGAFERVLIDRESVTLIREKHAKTSGKFKIKYRRKSKTA